VGVLSLKRMGLFFFLLFSFISCFVFSCLLVPLYHIDIIGIRDADILYHTVHAHLQHFIVHTYSTFANT
jgi:hypothetical protein